MTSNFLIRKKTTDDVRLETSELTEFTFDSVINYKITNEKNGLDIGTWGNAVAEYKKATVEVGTNMTVHDKFSETFKIMAGILRKHRAAEALASRTSSVAKPNENKNIDTSHSLQFKKHELAPQITPRIFAAISQESSSKEIQVVFPSKSSTKDAFFHEKAKPSDEIIYPFVEEILLILLQEIERSERNKLDDFNLIFQSIVSSAMTSEAGRSALRQFILLICTQN